MQEGEITNAVIQGLFRYCTIQQQLLGIRRYSVIYLVYEVEIDRLSDARFILSRIYTVYCCLKRDAYSLTEHLPTDVCIIAGGHTFSHWFDEPRV